jgi:hypothetical protein
MARLTVIVGLPGSGKSYRIGELRISKSGVCVADFMKDSIGHSPRFTDSKHYPRLIMDLRDGKDGVIADVAFCDTGRRIEAEQVVTRDVPEVTIDWEFFENGQAKCRDNARRRNRSNLTEELQKIEDLTAKYYIPRAAEQRTVWSPVT